MVPVAGYALIRPITVYQGKNYHGGENGYAKTGIVDFPRGEREREREREREGEREGVPIQSCLRWEILL